VRLTATSLQPLTGLVYQQARRGGGAQAARLSVDRLRVDTLPAGCDAVLVAGDLQGVTPSPFGGPPVLLGVALADYLAVWAAEALLPPPERIAVILAGDLYSAPAADQRGADGPVGDVWLAFAAAGCRRLLGVTGNHDELSAADVAACGPDATLLDGDWLDLPAETGPLRWAGVSGIAGDPRRLGRRPEEDQLALLDTVLAAGPDLLVLHEGPPGRRPEQRGSAAIGQRLARRPPPLTVCGHIHWPAPVSRVAGWSDAGAHVLNVDGRVLVLTR
jgi:3',5'-cyclic-AMP phosphodiesterase